MKSYDLDRPYEILLVEDSVTDVRMLRKALEADARKKNVTSLADGELAMDFLHSRAEGVMPDLMLLDLNLPKKDGWEVLAECKSDPAIKSVPIVVFTTSQLEKDVHRCYDLGANSFVAKPFELGLFMQVVQSIEDYWLGISASHRG